MKLIIHADPEKFSLAVRAAKALEPGRKDTILVYEDGTTFYVLRNKSDSVTVRQEIK